MRQTLITVAEAAEIVGVTPARVRQLIREGRLPAESVGPIWLLRRGQVTTFARKPRPNGRPKQSGKKSRTAIDKLCRRR